MISIPGHRWRTRQRYRPIHGLHCKHVVQVVHVKEVHPDYDVVFCSCECGGFWRWLNHHGRFV